MEIASLLRKFITVAAFTTALTGPQVVTAQDGRDFGAATGDTEAAQPPVYEVEFLVFTYNEFNPLEEEFEPSKPKLSQSLTDIRLTATPETLPPSSADWYLDSLTLPGEPSSPAEPAPGIPASEYDDTGQLLPATPGGPFDDAGNTFGSPRETDEAPGTWYRILDSEELELDRAVARLNALDAYTPLLHGGWSQAALLEDEAIPFELRLFGQLQPAGTIRLHRSRFLHLTIDVSVQDDYRYRQAPIAPGAVWPLAEFYGPTKYSIRTQRRIRSEELHFFDHPAFGILVVVRPAPEEPEAEATVAPGPAA